MSNLRVNSLADLTGNGPVSLHKQVAVKAWANLDGTGTISLRSSFNIASTVDNGTGDYTYNYTNSFANNNYCGQVTVTRGSQVIPHNDIISTQTSTTWRSTCSQTPNGASVGVNASDTARHLYCAIGDLA